MPDCLIALLHKIPCILHCENRIGIKLLTMLLIEGFSKAENQRIKVYAEQIQTIFNNRILGDDDSPAQWRLPMDDNGKNEGIIHLDNNRIQKIISNFDALANVSISDHSQLLKYSYCIPQYRQGMIILWQQEEFTDGDVKKFQEHINLWY